MADEEILETAGVTSTGSHSGELTKGLKLHYKSGSTWVALTDLQEVPALGNGAKDKVDVTTLDDDGKVSIPGLADYSQDLSFKFLYARSQFTTLANMTGVHEWKVTEGTSELASFKGEPTVSFDGGGVGAAKSYTLTVSCTEKITLATS